MEVIILWALSIIVSAGMKVGVAFDMFKYFADNGYKMSSKKETLYNGLENNNSAYTFSFKSLVIPLYNICMALYSTYNYVMKRDIIMETFYVTGKIEEMTSEEIELYNKKRSGLNAIKIATLSYKNELDKNKSDSENTSFTTITLNDGSKFVCNQRENGNGYEIVESSGPASLLPMNEQLEIVQDFMNGLKDKVCLEFGSVEEFIDAISKDSKRKSKKQIKALEKLKEEILKSTEDKEDSKEEENKENKGTTLKK